MAKFTTRLDNNFCFLSHNTSTSQSSILLNRTSRKNLQLQLSPSKHRFNFNVLCSIKEKENVKGEIEKVGGGASGGGLVNGVRVEELDRKTGLGRENASKEAGFDLVWPPWKNTPQRYKLIGTTSLAFVICNMDKVNLSVAIIPMSHQFGWNSSVAGVVQSSFFWGYALSQLPGGWLSKLFGGRKVLEIGVLAWSLATALVPVLAGFMPGLLLSRVLVGIGEGVSPSAATDLIARHVNTFGRAVQGCIICLWWVKCRKCYRASCSSDAHPKPWVGIRILFIWLTGDMVLSPPWSNMLFCECSYRQHTSYLTHNIHPCTATKSLITWPKDYNLCLEYQLMIVNDLRLCSTFAGEILCKRMET
ncbi:hypothetical protein GOBAR_DD36734 [Gossypium barbadense]|nr:hypothetical protein GOBAR_DD36734 [Gossypium barbadense]